jgi:hypothetical protein
MMAQSLLKTSPSEMMRPEINVGIEVLLIYDLRNGNLEMRLSNLPI